MFSYSHIRKILRYLLPLNLKSRTELFRRALHAFLLEAGEARVAEIFAQGQR